ncbi:hypothetical protein KCV01_g13042, partial [Aureobasidium melanogenum]
MIRFQRSGRSPGSGVARMDQGWLNHYDENFATAEAIGDGTVSTCYTRWSGPQADCLALTHDTDEATQLVAKLDCQGSLDMLMALGDGQCQFVLQYSSEGLEQDAELVAFYRDHRRGPTLTIHRGVRDGVLVCPFPDDPPNDPLANEIRFENLRGKLVIRRVSIVSR